MRREQTGKKTGSNYQKKPQNEDPRLNASFLAYPIERSVIEPNRTPIVRLGSVIEHNRTHNKIWPVELNRTFDYRTTNNRTQSNVRLPNSCLFILRTFCTVHRPPDPFLAIRHTPG